MPVLTLENLDPARLPFYDYAVINRGRSLHHQKKVTITSFDGTTATCDVQEDRIVYQVIVTAETSYRVAAACTCPQSQRAFSCRHILAAIYAVRDDIQNRAGKLWQYKMKVALDSAPAVKPSPKTKNRYALVFGLKVNESSYDRPDADFLVFRIRTQTWHGSETLLSLPTRKEQNEFLDKDRSWTHAAEQVYGEITPSAVINLPEREMLVYNLIRKHTGFYYGNTTPAAVLPMLAEIDAPVFLMRSYAEFKERLQFQTEPLQIAAALTKKGRSYSLQAGMQHGQNTFTTNKGNLRILSLDPGWVLVGKTIAPVENIEALRLLNLFSMDIPEEEAEEFREKYLPQILKRVPVVGDVLQWEDLRAEPRPRLYLFEDHGTLRARLCYAYDVYELETDLKYPRVSVTDIPGSWSMMRIHREPETENAYYHLLTDARYGLKRASNAFPAGTFELRARTHPLDFLIHSIPLLAKAGFEVFGEDTLKSNRLNRNKPTISLNITSGLDWFDINAVVHYGDQSVPLAEMRRALRKRERYIKLADGSIGQVPEEWLERYRQLFDLAEETDDGLRVRDVHIPLVDTLLADAEETQVAAEFQQRRELLQSFEHIRSQPVPKGFNGELRPYQQAGVDWLHFLNEYGFGGCLADDMGLGKTIQALAFLQSLREQGKLKGPSLMVVPKSLIANWQREADRFTPALRILEYIGNLRNKDTALFQNYDVILTTYGTMLRDIDVLRKVTFLYAILDESQNIKNPLSQSAKAARLLKAHHRLVMTGTPVENNTFELWSQFAFLIPGLLGSLEYFKREFATPIESRADTETAKLLRRLVYPFILRRTKEQVAPELPERTERILYTDLAPAQRKIYNQTRDYYRGMLLGMIEEDGIDDARMKILEGLLRLRQVCIHPSLVEPAYHGEAAKFDLLMETLESVHAEGHKALVFSQFVQSLHILRRMLDELGIRYAYLDGQTTDRQAQVDAFQNTPELTFFLISLKAGGVGLNLTAADYVIHLDPWWNPAVEMQAADRAHRIGQSRPVFIYKLIARDSVEEKILKLQEHKKELVDQIISAEGSFFKSITKEDVKALFS